MGIFDYFIVIAIGLFAQKVRGRNGVAWGAFSLAAIGLGGMYIEMGGGSKLIWTVIVSITAMLLLIGLKPGNKSNLSKQVECPFCAETISAKAKVCKHCGKEVALGSDKVEGVVTENENKVADVVASNEKEKPAKKKNWFQKNAMEFAALAGVLVILLVSNGSWSRLFSDTTKTVEKDRGETMNVPPSSTQLEWSEVGRMSPLTAVAWQCVADKESKQIRIFGDSTFVEHFISGDIEVVTYGDVRIKGDDIALHTKANTFLSAPAGIPTMRWTPSAKAQRVEQSNNVIAELRMMNSTETQLDLKPIRRVNWDGRSEINDAQQPVWLCTPAPDSIDETLTTQRQMVPVGIDKVSSLTPARVTGHFVKTAGTTGQVGDTPKRQAIEARQEAVEALTQASQQRHCVGLVSAYSRQFEQIDGQLEQNLNIPGYASSGKNTFLNIAAQRYSTITKVLRNNRCAI